MAEQSIPQDPASRRIIVQGKAGIQMVHMKVIRDVLEDMPPNAEGLIEEQLMLAIGEAVKLGMDVLKDGAL